MTLSRKKLEAQKQTDPLTPEEWADVRTIIEACQDIPDIAGDAVSDLKGPLDEERCQSHATKFALLCLDAQREISRYRYFSSLHFTPCDGKHGTRIEDGCVVRLRNGYFLLVGDVNQALGKCGCCQAFRHHAIDAVAYGILPYTEKEE